MNWWWNLKWPLFWIKPWWWWRLRAATGWWGDINITIRRIRMLLWPPKLSSCRRWSSRPPTSRCWNSSSSSCDTDKTIKLLTDFHCSFLNQSAATREKPLFQNGKLLKLFFAKKLHSSRDICNGTILIHILIVPFSTCCLAKFCPVNARFWRNNERKCYHRIYTAGEFNYFFYL